MKTHADSTQKTPAGKKPQIDKFREAARELETDDSEEAFKRVVKKIAGMPLAKRKPKDDEPAKRFGRRKREA